MAVIPLSATNIRLIKGVPFYSDYKDTRWFDTQSQQTNYFMNKPLVHEMTQANFQRVEKNYRVRVDRHVDDLREVNYLMFRNRDYTNKWFYCFVTDLEYRNTNVTYVHFRLDVFQTWKFDMNFKPSYVSREHRPLWNSDGSPVINTVEEGLAYGDAYETVSVENWKPLNDIFWFVMVVKSASHAEQAGQPAHDNEIIPTVNGMPQGLTYYVHPFRMSGSNPNVQIGGSNYDINSTLDLIKGAFSQTSLANNIVSMYVTDYIGFRPSYNESSDTLNFNENMFTRAMIADDQNQNVNTIAVKNLPDYISQSHSFGNKYDGFKNVRESKLLMYPYAVTVLDDFKGNRVEIKNEYIEGNELSIRAMGSIGTFNKVVYAVRDYLTDDLELTDESTVSMEHALINKNPNDVPVMNDYLSAYLQGNKNSIDTQKESLFWNGIMSAGTGLISMGSAGRVTSAGNVNYDAQGIAGINTAQGMFNSYMGIKQINSKIKDIDNIPPQTVKMGSNTSFDYGNGYYGVYVIKKQIRDEYIEILEDYFNKFGYQTNRIKIPNFHTRQNWNYVQTESCTITGDFNNEDLNELKQVFDNGITFWHTDDVGNYDLSNGVI